MPAHDDICLGTLVPGPRTAAYLPHGFESFQPNFRRTPGFGDTNRTDVISELRRARWHGSFDIGGWHDPVPQEEMTGQVHGLNHLKRGRGGAFVPDPDVSR